MKLFTKRVFAGLCLALFCVLAACTGGGGGSAAPALALFAGNMGGSGNIDGPAASARLGRLYHIAGDSSGNHYVADATYHTIRKISPDGEVTTLAGASGIRGSTDGTGAAATFCWPMGIASDSAGNLYVADSGNNTIRKIAPGGIVTTLAGTPGPSGSADGAGAAARFSSPAGVATDVAGNVYVADSGNNTIRKITPDGMVTTLAGSPGPYGSADGAGAAARFFYPDGVATDVAGNVYVADSFNHTIRKITPDGMVTTLAGMSGAGGRGVDGNGAAAKFSIPTGVATDSMGNVYVADTGNDVIRKITPDGSVTTLAGTVRVAGNADGMGAAASFKYPRGISADSANNLYVTDYGNFTVRKITPAGAVTTLAGISSVSGSADGAGAAARFFYPQGVAADSAGNLYVADSGNHTIRKITPNGMVSTLAGVAGIGGSADGTGGAASFAEPADIAADSAGNLYVADSFNHTIRKITPDGAVTTLAGTAGVVGHADGTGAAASFWVITGIATDGAGNVYVADMGDSIIRKITPDGEVTTLAGTAGIWGSADGTGAAARFRSPGGMATDSAGNLYVADYGNHCIRKITPGGVVTTLAGTPAISGSNDGVGASASFSRPMDIAADSAGNLYVADPGNDTIRKITPDGIVTTVAGVAGVAGFTPGPLPGVLSPQAVAISGASLFVVAFNGVAVVNNVP